MERRRLREEGGDSLVIGPTLPDNSPILRVLVPRIKESLENVVTLSA
jgi:hypothetical protein